MFAFLQKWQILDNKFKKKFSFQKLWIKDLDFRPSRLLKEDELKQFRTQESDQNCFVASKVSKNLEQSKCLTALQHCNDQLKPDFSSPAPGYPSNFD